MKPSTKEWGYARETYDTSEKHIDNCEQCKKRPSYTEGRCYLGENLHTVFEKAVDIARDSIPDGRNFNKGTGRKSIKKIRNQNAST